MAFVTIVEVRLATVVVDEAVVVVVLSAVSVSVVVVVVVVLAMNVLETVTTGVSVVELRDGQARIPFKYLLSTYMVCVVEVVAVIVWYTGPCVTVTGATG